MQIIYDSIQLDPSQPQVTVCGDEWAINPKQHTLQHAPTKTVFEVFLKRDVEDRGTINAMDFFADLVAIADGCALPPPEMIESLARQAIALYLVAHGCLKPRDQEDDHIPEELMQQAHAC